MRQRLRALIQGLIEAPSAPALLAACALWLALTAWIRPLTLPDEGRYIGVAWEMLRSGNWLVPTLDGMPFFHKPPLFYWIAAAGLKLFGNVEWAGRLPSFLAGMVMCGTLHAFLRRHVDRSTANLSVVVLVTMPFFFVGAQFANLDMLVAGMISATVISGAHAILALQTGAPHRLALASAYAFAALGILAKGLIGIVLPGAILFAWLLVNGYWRVIPRLLAPQFILLFAAIAAPWFWLMEQAHPGFFNYFFVYHHFQRFSETGFNNQRAFWFYLPVLLALTLPWSAWIWRAFRRNVLREREMLTVRSLMLLWLLGILVFFSLPNSKLVGYILPTLPPFAFLLADALLGERRHGTPLAPLQSSASIGATLLLAVGICVAIPPAVRALDKVSFKPVSTAMRPEFVVGDQIVMLEEYQYDMPFYLRAEHPAWIVSRWDDPDIPRKDNWRKELYDAGHFDRPAMDRILVHADRLAARLCAHDRGTLWIWGRPDRAGLIPGLAQYETFYANGRKSLWRLDASARQRLMACP